MIRNLTIVAGFVGEFSDISITARICRIVFGALPVFPKDISRKIERAANQYACRRIGLRNGCKRLGDAIGACGGDACGDGGGLCCLGGEGVCLAGDRNRNERFGKRRHRGQIAFDVFGVQHTANEMRWPLG